VKQRWGTVNGRDVWLFTLRCEAGVEVTLTNYGSTVVRLITPDRHGSYADIVLGFDSLEDYVASSRFMCGVVGRVANRIANAAFRLDDEHVELSSNEPPHHLHGGHSGFDKHVWNVESLDRSSASLSLASSAGDEGYPGEVSTMAHYSLTDAGDLRIEFEGSTDAPTLWDPVQHIYWNLAGHDAGPIRRHRLLLDCDRVLEIDRTGIPTGALKPVRGTRFDFSKHRAIASSPNEPLDDLRSIDHYFVRREPADSSAVAAELQDPGSGRTLRLSATHGGLQVYTGDDLDSIPLGKAGRRYASNAGVCLEPHHRPNAVNTPGWPAPVLRPGETKRSTTVLSFGVRPSGG
jgi:aldose 1-epimerase